MRDQQFAGAGSRPARQFAEVCLERYFWFLQETTRAEDTGCMLQLSQEKDNIETGCLWRSKRRALFQVSDVRN
jgi:hypothetical protein